MKAYKDKESIIREFQHMESFEKWAGDFYRQISFDPRIEDEKIKNTFRLVAGDEERHAELVKIIINIIKNSL